MDADVAAFKRAAPEATRALGCGGGDLVLGEAQLEVFAGEEAWSGGVGVIEVMLARLRRGVRKEVQMLCVSDCGDWESVCLFVVIGVAITVFVDFRGDSSSACRGCFRPFGRFTSTWAKDGFPLVGNQIEIVILLL